MTASTPIETRNPGFRIDVVNEVDADGTLRASCAQHCVPGSLQRFAEVSTDEPCRPGQQNSHDSMEKA